MYDVPREDWIPVVRGDVIGFLWRGSGVVKWNSLSNSCTGPNGRHIIRQHGIPIDFSVSSVYTLPPLGNHCREYSAKAYILSFNTG